MILATCQLPDQPRVNSTKTQIPLFGQLMCLRDVFQNPAHFCSGKIGISYQSCSVSQNSVKTLLLQLLTIVSSTPALPVNSRCNCFSSISVPCYSGFTLVCYSHRCNVLHCQGSFFQHLLNGLGLANPYLLRVLLNPS